jgi:hypothetical protein
MRWMALALLAGCMPTRQGLTGDWAVTLSCDEAFDAVAACPGDMTSLIRIWKPDDGRASLSDGSHRTLFPGNVDLDGSYTGVTGPVVATWEDGDLSLELIANADDVLASAEDLAAWEAHRLLIRGRPADRCWDATWSWLDADGVVAAEGPALAAHRWRECE